MNTEVKYVLHSDIFSRIDALDKKFAHFDRTLAGTDHRMSGLGRGMNTNMLGGRFAQGVEMLNSIPNLNSGILASAGSLANPYVAAGAAVIAFGAAAKKAKDFAEEWNIDMSMANVTIQETPAGLQMISDKLKGMPRYGTDMLVIPKAFNDIISGVGDVDDSMDILQNALKGARAGYTDLNIVSNAGVNILNSVGDKVSGAKEVYDVLFATLNKGKGTFKDIADYLPRIIPFSNQLGISFKETSAAFALMTSKGQTTEQTTMLLQNAFVSLLDGKKREKMEKFVKIFDHGKIRPFTAIIGDLSNKMKGMSDQKRVKLLDALGLDAQAASAFSVLSQNSDKLKEFTDYINKSSEGEGAMEKALGDSKNSTDNVNRIKEKWESWKMSLGQKVVPFWDKFTGGIADLMGWLEKVEKQTGFFSSAWKVATNVFKFARAPLFAIWNIGMKLFKWAWDFGSYLHNRFPTAFMVIGKVIQTVTGFVRDLWFVLTETFDVLTKIVTFDWGSLGENIDNFKNRDWTTNGTKEKVVYTDQDKLAAYNRAISMGIPKSKVDAYAKQLGITIPGQDKKPKASVMPAAAGSNFDIDDDKKKAKDNKALREVAGGGSQIRNITIHIGKQIEKVEVITTNIQELSATKIKRILEELMVTQVRDAEAALSF